MVFRVNVEKEYRRKLILLERKQKCGMIRKRLKFDNYILELDKYKVHNKPHIDITLYEEDGTEISGVHMTFKRLIHKGYFGTRISLHSYEFSYKIAFIGENVDAVVKFIWYNDGRPSKVSIWVGEKIKRS